MRVGIPYKVIGGTRFYDRREVKDALAYLQGGRQPGRRGVAQAGPQRAQARRRRHDVGRLDAWANGHGVTFVEALRARRGRRRAAAPRSRASTRSSTLLDELRRAASTTGPAALLEAHPRRQSGYLAELEAEHTSRPRAGWRTSPSSSASAREFETVDAFLEQVSLVADTDEIDDDESPGRAHDAALGQGPRVPGRVPDRHGGRRLPAPALPRRARRSSRRSAGSPTSASPAAASASTSTNAWSRTSSAPRSTTRRAGSSTRSPRTSSPRSAGRARGQKGSGWNRSFDRGRRDDTDGRVFGGRDRLYEVASRPAATPPPTTGARVVGPAHRRRCAPQQVGRRRDPRHRGRRRQGRGAGAVPVGRREAAPAVMGAAREGPARGLPLRYAGG